MPNLMSNYIGRAISGLSMRNKRAFVSARRGLDTMMSSKVARYSTMAAGAGLGYYGYTHDSPLAMAAGAGILGGMAYGGHMGSYAGAGARTAAGVADRYMGMGIDKTRAMYRMGRMRGRGVAKNMRPMTDPYFKPGRPGTGSGPDISTGFGSRGRVAYL